MSEKDGLVIKFNNSYMTFAKFQFQKRFRKKRNEMERKEEKSREKEKTKRKKTKRDKLFRLIIRIGRREFICLQLHFDICTVTDALRYK